jgi:hypothetical protein
MLDFRFGYAEKPTRSLVGFVLFLAVMHVCLILVTPAWSWDDARSDSPILLSQVEAEAQIEAEARAEMNVEAQSEAQEETRVEESEERRESRPLEPRYQPREPEKESWYNGSYIFGMTRGVANSTIAPAGKVPLFVLTVPLDIVFLPFAAIGGLFG